VPVIQYCSCYCGLIGSHFDSRPSIGVVLRPILVTNIPALTIRRRGILAKKKTFGDKKYCSSFLYRENDLCCHPTNVTVSNQFV